MKDIVPSGYAVPREEIKRLMDELRQSRAAELASATEHDRARIDKEIRREVERKIHKLHPRGLFSTLLSH
jgi:DNA-binding transcriptional MerR regulator